MLYKAKRCLTGIVISGILAGSILTTATYIDNLIAIKRIQTVVDHYADFITGNEDGVVTHEEAVNFVDYSIIWLWSGSKKEETSFLEDVFVSAYYDQLGNRLSYKSLAGMLENAWTK